MACSGISSEPGTSKKSMSPSPYPCLTISAVKRDPAPIDDLLVPTGLHEGDPPSAVILSRDMVLTLTHGCSSSKKTQAGADGSRRMTPHASANPSLSLPSGL